MDFAYTIAGFAVGAIVGLTGVGGGSLMTPLLVLMFGIHPSVAVGTDLLYAAITGSHEFAVFFLACVVVAGAYGAWSVNKRIFFVQALPAIIGLLALFL